MANSENEEYEEYVQIEISLEEIDGLIMPDDYTGPIVSTSPSVYVNGEHTQEKESKEDGHTEKLTEAVYPSTSADVTHNGKKRKKAGLKCRNRNGAQRRRELKKKREAELLADSEDENATVKTPKRKRARKRAELKATSTGWQVTKTNEEDLSDSFSDMSLD